jgi:cytoskeletal protein RodZ
MRPRIYIFICLIAAFVLAQVSTVTAQTAPSSSTAQAAPTTSKKSAGGERSVTGCVAQEGEGFVLKTDEGTYTFDTSRDLTPFLGKMVTIVGTWKATGVTTTAPIKDTAAASAQKTNDEKKAGSAKAFVGDLHLHITGTVVGDCPQSK